MINRFSYFLLFFFTCIFALISCDKLTGKKDEGIISYEISYPIPFEDKWMERLMPKEMDLKFKGANIKTELSFGLGMIKIGYLSDSEKKEVHELLKFMKNKNFAHRNDKEVALMLKEIPQHKITFGNKEKEIAGYNCKNAKVEILEPDSAYTIEIWYTEDLKITNPNWCTPYKEISGVLMEYQVEKLDVVMKFTAKKVQLSEIPAEEFKLPEGYNKISFQEMEANLQQLKDI